MEWIALFAAAPLLLIGYEIYRQLRRRQLRRRGKARSLRNRAYSHAWNMVMRRPRRLMITDEREEE